MDLFYVSPVQLDLERGRAVIDGDEFHHLSRVLRSRVGDSIAITDGAGLAAQLKVDAIGKRSLEGTVSQVSRVPRPETSVTVAISLLKSPHRFDLFLEKATELGVDRIIPMTTRRTVSTPAEEKFNRKAERWRSVVHAAARQCRRHYLPEVSEPMPLGEVQHLAGYDLRLMPWESERRMPGFDPAGKRILFLVGGEGGFTPEEVAGAEAAGFQPVTFGATILRAETAGIFAVALVRSRLLMEADAAQWL
ncbi:MAG: 16S rRNA (uracil(1498)-N(3))-methyltransferase [Chlorobiaceae bacterium]|nr:16S rRNA (uracil(1498)-N(3))-methyltransferase [Chlorobiaceae bacterium]